MTTMWVSSGAFVCVWMLEACTEVDRVCVWMRLIVCVDAGVMHGGLTVGRLAR
jgi:hypothetical protein